MSRSRSRPEFFLDRSLGRHQVAAALREAGWCVRTHFEVFGRRDEEVSDAEWLEYCGREDLVVLTKDRRLRYRAAELAAIRRHRVRVFVLTSGHLKAAEQAARFIALGRAIEEAATDPGPRVLAVGATRLARIFP